MPAKPPRRQNGATVVSGTFDPMVATHAERLTN